MSNGILAIGVPANLQVAQELLARGRRLARAFDLGWVAVVVQKRAGRRLRDDDSTLREISDLVGALGGEIRLSEGRDVVEELLRITHEQNAAILLIGQSHRPRLLRRLIRGTTEHLLRARRPFDVIVAHDEGVP